RLLLLQEGQSWPLPNVWLGTSASDQASADLRIPKLLDCPAAVRFASLEPLLGPVSLIDRDPIRLATGVDARPENRVYVSLLRGWGLGPYARPGLDWVIVGGESGRNARPMHPDWARSLRDQCVAAGVPFFFKQWGEWLPWEMGSAPMWGAQNGRSEDGNILFPADIDSAPDWQDGLSEYEPGVTDHAAFQRVGKARAGRLLDGRKWDQVPEAHHG
ncbi:MAG: DUF5131 family protein, partial [Paracoccus sp. (in: a-proteobacteria)]